MICRKCGSTMSDQAKFCPGCGAAAEDNALQNPESVTLQPAVVISETPQAIAKNSEHSDAHTAFTNSSPVAGSVPVNGEPALRAPVSAVTGGYSYNVAPAGRPGPARITNPSASPYSQPQYVAPQSVYYGYAQPLAGNPAMHGWSGGTAAPADYSPRKKISALALVGGIVACIGAYLDWIPDMFSMLNIGSIFLVLLTFLGKADTDVFGEIMESVAGGQAFLIFLTMAICVVCAIWVLVAACNKKKCIGYALTGLILNLVLPLILISMSGGSMDNAFDVYGELGIGFWIYSAGMLFGAIGGGSG